MKGGKKKKNEKKEKSANEQTSPAFWHYSGKRIYRKGLLKYYNKGRTLLPVCFLFLHINCVEGTLLRRPNIPSACSRLNEHDPQ